MLRDKIITINNSKENARISSSILHKLLPFVLILSFMWLGFYPALCAFNVYPMGVVTGSVAGSLIVQVILMGLLYWIGFEIIMWVYRFCLGFSIYTFIVPIQAIKDNLKWCFILRNIVMGALYFLCIWYPYIYIYLIIIDAICLFAIFLLFSFVNMKKYVEPVVQPFVFKGLMLPFIVYEFINMGAQVAGYLL